MVKSKNIIYIDNIYKDNDKRMKIINPKPKSYISILLIRIKK